ncbi:hypothetical protein ABZP36_017619 [Zizania latifolia]
MVISYRCSAGPKLTWIFSLQLILVATVQAQRPSPSGFLSIDCGLTNSSTYNDIDTNLTYVSDGGYVESGKNYNIMARFMQYAANGQEKTLRSFPDGQRNCYTLPSTNGKKYLIRTTFTYGNYDGLNSSRNASLFLFGLHIGVNFWTTVNLTKLPSQDTIWKEVLTVASDKFISVCLINFGYGTPFISTLDMRPLDNLMYPFVNTSVSINYFSRLRFGSVVDPITRYPVDNYDRFWESWSSHNNSYPWVSLNTTRNVSTVPGDQSFQVPSKILQKASTIESNFSWLYITVKASDNLRGFGPPELLPIFHFAELDSNASTNRTFDIYSDNELLFPNFKAVNWVVSMHDNGRFLRNVSTGFTLRKLPTSKLPPLINAFEVYSLVRMDNHTTASNDVDYMTEVKKYYSLARNWNGDPCSPREYSWEGLTCDYATANPNPKITRVNLSASGLRGGLDISFMKMASLENLDLSHNNLTGAIPDYQSKSLTVLDLSNNQLDGPIPDSILQRYKAGLLELRLEGNPICSKVKDRYCANKKNSKTILLVAVIVPVVFVLLLVVLCILWKLCWKGKSEEQEDYAMYEEETPLHIDIRRFTYAELKLITNNFQSIIGKGGFGTVYHGILENNDEVAVKVLVETSIDESKDFLPEVQTLSKVHHKNLVALVGYCQNKKCLALVYDFMPRGNLQQLLRGGYDCSLNWEERLHIALDAAQGIYFELCIHLLLRICGCAYLVQNMSFNGLQDWTHTTLHLYRLHALLEKKSLMVISYRFSAGTKLTWILSLQLILVATIQVQSASPPDFISIDCGLTNSSRYNDSVTNLTYVSDRGYVEGGKNYNIMLRYMKDATNDQEKTLKSFPEGQRNCYTLPSTSGKKYLIRTTFTYGNYDGLNSSENGSLFLFGLHIGVNFWTAVNLTKWISYNTVWKEVLTIASDEFISVCLINLGYGTPFISALDLRPLQDSMYPVVNTSVSISYFSRLRFGSVDDYITRYPTDKYDRFWESWSRYNISYPWLNLTTTRQVKTLPGDEKFQVPSEILQKASTINSRFNWLNITVKSSYKLLVTRALDLEQLPIFHFAELDNNDSMNRVFDIYRNTELLSPDFTPSRFRVDSMYQDGRFLPNMITTFSLRQQPRSQLPPLINAFELYSLVQMDNHTTASNDVDCMKEVKKYYTLARNWNGDPCSPREYSWEGLTCDYATANPNPRITRVNLSASRLRGGLDISFMKMTSLENLDLSQNNLTGDIPDYQLNSLRVLDLSNNQLNGSIPDSILQRYKAGLLELRLEGNPICSKVKDRYCANKKNSTATLLVAVIVPVVQTLSKVHHKNLVALVGYCQNKKCLALVYDFMPKGNLQQLLSGGYDCSLNWEERLHIALDAAQVFMDPQTIHLPNWVRQKIAKGSIHDVVDKKMLDQYDATHLQTVIDLAMNCLENASIDRPSMTEVVSVLKVCLPALSSEKQSAVSTTRRKNVMDADISKQFQLMISGASTTSYKGSPFQSVYTGFLSIDCGLTDSSDYTDNVTNLEYVSDREYIEGGKNYNIMPQYMKGTTNVQRKTLRSFPDSQRNCYTLPSTSSKKYLVRTTFTYGNYDGLNSSENGSLFLFGLHIGVNFWTAVNLTEWSSYYSVCKEVLTIASDKFISVCLINLGYGSPFISTLELRPLDDLIYPVDKYDRFWESWSSYNNSYPWISLNTVKKLCYRV